MKLRCGMYNYVACVVMEVGCTQSYEEVHMLVMIDDVSTSTNSPWLGASAYPLKRWLHVFAASKTVVGRILLSGCHGFSADSPVQ